MYEIHVQRGRKISVRAAGQPSHIDIIVIALLETRLVVGGVVCVRAGDARFRGERTNETPQGRGGEGSRRHYAKEMVSSVIPGSQWPRRLSHSGHLAELFLQDCPRIMDGPEPVAHQSLMDVWLY